MKKILVLLTVLLTAAILFAQDTFCDGWDAGYQAGVCYGKNYGCIPPITPICPIARIGEEGFQDGYNRGFLAGLSHRR